jgi:hypothetical protein
MKRESPGTGGIMSSCEFPAAGNLAANFSCFRQKTTNSARIRIFCLSAGKSAGNQGKTVISGMIASTYGEFPATRLCRAGNLQGKLCPKLEPVPPGETSRPLKRSPPHTRRWFAGWMNAALRPKINADQLAIVCCSGVAGPPRLMMVVSRRHRGQKCSK